MQRLVSLILRNVFRNKRRSMLTLASTAVSLALLTLLVGLYQAFFYGEDVSPSQASRIVCRHRVSITQLLPSSQQQLISQVPGVVKVTPMTWFQGVYKDPKNFFARMSVDADTIFDVHKDWITPPDQLAAFKRGRTACAVAEVIAKKYSIKLGDTVTIVGDYYPVTLELKVVSIFQAAPQTEAMIFHREYVNELLSKNSTARDKVGWYLILAQRPDQVPGISRAIDSLFDNSPYPTRTESEKEFGRSFMAFMGNIKLFLAMICAAVTFTILLVSANTVAMAVRERTRETAILRTLGFTPGEILQLIVGESVAISIIGGLLGLGLGWLLTVAMSSGDFEFQGLKWQALVIVLTMAAFIGLLASLVPAMIASRKNVVESLRFTG